MKDILNNIQKYCNEIKIKDNFITIKPRDIKSLSIHLFRDLDCDLASVVCLKEENDFVIKYLYSYNKKDIFFIVEQKVNNSFKSLSKEIPALNWFEREIYDMFGVEPIGHLDLRPLYIFPENYPKDFHPLVDSSLKSDKSYGEYEYKDIKAEGVYQVLVGPIHAGIIEPGHFRFSMAGEPILQLEIRHFWKHRGIEKLCENKSIDDVLNISQKISGDNALSFALSFAQTVEKICDIEISEFAKYSRMIAGELERISCLLVDIGGVFQDIAYSLGAQHMSALKEDIMRLIKKLSGNRFFKNFIVIGGVSKDITPFYKETLKVLNDVEERVKLFDNLMENSASILERFETTGEIEKDIAKDLSCVGFCASASGRFNDFRKIHPYLLYKNVDFDSIILQSGDVYARTKVKISHIFNSISIIKSSFKHISSMKEKEKVVSFSIKDGEAFGYSESSRGNIITFVKIKDAKVVRFKPRDPSFMNWQAIQFAVVGRTVDVIGDFPLVNKSLNLSYAGNDL